MSKELHYRFRLDLIESPVLLRRIPHRAEEDTVRLAERVLKGPDVIQGPRPSWTRVSPMTLMTRFS